MRKLVTGSVMAVALALMFGGAAMRAQGLVLDLKIDRLPPGATVIMAMNIGKIPSSTNTAKVEASGEALFALNLASLGKTDATPVDVYVGECPDKSIRIEIIAAGGKPPADCNKKKIGVFWLNRTAKIVIHYPGTLVTGNFFMTPVGLAIIGGGAATGLAIGLSGGDDDGDDDDDTPGGNDNPGNNNNVFTSYNATYTGTLNKTADGCGFSQTAAVTGVLNLNTTGAGTWIKTHTAVPATFNFNVQASTISAGISYTSSTTGLNGTYNVTDVVSIQSKTATVTQTFVRITSPCTAMYQGTLNRP